MPKTLLLIAWFTASSLVLATTHFAVVSASATNQRNGFNLEGALIPVAEILPGGPAKDGIPAIDNPQFLPSGSKPSLEESDLVLGINYNGIAKAYPIRIMNWHEIVNDRFKDDYIAVTFCPLCGSGMAFLAMIEKNRLEFGVSGLLYNSDVLLYDRSTNSLWSQLMMTAVSGPYRGTKLQQIVVEHTTWLDWHNNYPDTLVLSFDTGYQRDYKRDPYAGYQLSNQTFFPVQYDARRFHPKQLVIGLEINGIARAWPFNELSKSSGPVEDFIGSTPLSISYDPQHNSAVIKDASGNTLPATTLFWFAWSAFHPTSEVYLFKP